MDLWGFAPPQFYFEHHVATRSIELRAFPFSDDLARSRHELLEFMQETQAVAVVFYMVNGYYSHFYHLMIDVVVPIFHYFWHLRGANEGEGTDRHRRIYIGDFGGATQLITHIFPNFVFPVDWVPQCFYHSCLNGIAPFRVPLVRLLGCAQDVEHARREDCERDVGSTLGIPYRFNGFPTRFRILTSALSAYMHSLVRSSPERSAVFISRGRGISLSLKNGIFNSISNEKMPNFQLFPSLKNTFLSTTILRTI